MWNEVLKLEYIIGRKMSFCRLSLNRIHKTPIKAFQRVLSVSLISLFFFNKVAGVYGVRGYSILLLVHQFFLKGSVYLWFFRVVPD